VKVGTFSTQDVFLTQQRGDVASQIIQSHCVAFDEHVSDPWMCWELAHGRTVRCELSSIVECTQPLQQVSGLAERG
jgi:hypothetical protein